MCISYRDMRLATFPKIARPSLPHTAMPRLPPHLHQCVDLGVGVRKPRLVHSKRRMRQQLLHRRKKRYRAGAAGEQAGAVRQRQARLQASAGKL